MQLSRKQLILIVSLSGVALLLIAGLFFVIRCGGKRDPIPAEPSLPPATEPPRPSDTPSPSPTAEPTESPSPTPYFLPLVPEGGTGTPAPSSPPAGFHRGGLPAPRIPEIPGRLHPLRHRHAPLDALSRLRAFPVPWAEIPARRHIRSSGRMGLLSLRSLRPSALRTPPLLPHAGDAASGFRGEGTATVNKPPQDGPGKHPERKAGAPD